jgi:hypothetical protein
MDEQERADFKERTQAQPPPLTSWESRVKQQTPENMLRGKRKGLPPAGARSQEEQKARQLRMAEQLAIAQGHTRQWTERRRESQRVEYTEWLTAIGVQDKMDDLAYYIDRFVVAGKGGSTRRGQPPTDLEKLVAMLSEETYDEDTEEYEGDFQDMLEDVFEDDEDGESMFREETKKLSQKLASQAMPGAMIRKGQQNGGKRNKSKRWKSNQSRKKRKSKKKKKTSKKRKSKKSRKRR